MKSINHIVIAGSGPVGSFIAVLCSLLGFRVTVYEKREKFTRTFHVKIESGFFREVQEVLSRLNVENNFFAELHEYLNNNKDRIVIKELEERFTREAKSLGAKYVRREVKSFAELYEEHEASNPIILDCTGKNSSLRTSKFGQDVNNLVTVPLQHAMYISFKAEIVSNRSLYQVMKYVKNIKLTDVIVSKCKDNSGLSDVTIPVFITDELALFFDKEHPDINRKPLNPFNSLTAVSDSIFYPITSIIGNLLIDGWKVDLNSVKVKKIEISCGYAKRRSSYNYVCLGDSAVYLAFFRSLNLGLKHALEFFVILSMYHKEETSVQFFQSDDIIAQFQECNSHLNPIKVYPTEARNVFLVVTKIIRYGCFSYCLTNHKTERLTGYLGVNEYYVYDILKQLNQTLRTWGDMLMKFEAKRDEDIKFEMQGNEAKSALYDNLSWFIDLNGKSFIKVSEFVRVVSGKSSLLKKDFKFLLKCFKARREAIKTAANSKISNYVLLCIISNLLCQKKNKGSSVLDKLEKYCAAEYLSNKEKIAVIDAIVSDVYSCSDYILIGMKYMPSDENIILTIIKNELAEQQNLKHFSSELNLSLTNTNFEFGAGPSMERKSKSQASEVKKNYASVSEDASEKSVLAYPFIHDYETVEYIKSHGKVMFVIRRDGGTTKWMLDSMLLQKYPSGVMCNADSYFQQSFVSTSQTGFSKSSLDYCLERVREEFTKSRSPIIVKTLMKKESVQPFINLASEYKYTVIMPTAGFRSEVFGQVESKMCASTSNVVKSRKYTSVSNVKSKKFTSTSNAVKNQRWASVSDLGYELNATTNRSGVEEYFPTYLGWFLDPVDSLFLLNKGKEAITAVIDNSKFCCTFETYSKEKIQRYFKIEDPLFCIGTYCGSGCNKMAKKFCLSDDVQNVYGKFFSLVIQGFIISKSFLLAVASLSSEMKHLLFSPQECSSETDTNTLSSDLGALKNSYLMLKAYESQMLYTGATFEKNFSTVGKTAIELDWDENEMINTGATSIIMLGRSQKVSSPITDVQQYIHSAFSGIVNFDCNIPAYVFAKSKNQVQYVQMSSGTWFVKARKKIQIGAIFTGLYN